MKKTSNKVSKNNEYLDKFLVYLKDEKRYSENTVIAYKNDILNFYNFLDENEFGDADEISPKIAEWYTASLRDKFVPKTIQRKISSIKTYYSYFLNIEKIFSSDPFLGIALPKVEKRLPKFIYDNEIKDFFSGIVTSTELGKRDILIFTLLYGSGLRVSELTTLKLKDVNIKERIISVHGKGSKDRLVPMSVETQKNFNDYLILSRPVLLSRSDDLENDNIFLNFKGTNLTSRGVRDILDRLINEQASSLRVSPHDFRHSFACHLLNKGMDVRMVQELLGHTNLSTTQIYTKISRENLIAQYENAFPKGKK